MLLPFPVSRFPFPVREAQGAYARALISSTLRYGGSVLSITSAVRTIPSSNMCGTWDTYTA